MELPNKIDLFKALERDEIVPYFQPLVELNSGRLSGFEVLARWNHPTYGMVSPDHFIRVAEESGSIGVLSEKLLRKVFLAAPAIPHPLTISFNVSTIEFHDPNFPRRIQQAASDGGFPLSRLILEVTESALVGNLQDVLAITQELKRLGVRLALDDFGTAYSSLRHLQSLPFDELKVDASFVRSMDRTRESRKIAAAVVGLGHSLGLVTVGEGIETRMQAEMLLWLGCDLGQGWLFGRAVPVEEVPGIVAKEFLGNEDAAPSEALGGEVATSLEAHPAQRLAQLQAIYDGSPVGLCFLDTGLRYVSVNRQLAEMNGLPVSSHLGRRIQEVLPKAFVDLVEPFMRRALGGESLSGIEEPDPRERAGGPLRTLLASYEPARDEAGEVVGVAIAVVDITLRKIAEQALQESEDHYRHAVELNPQIPWTMDPTGAHVDISPRWRKATGLTVEDVNNWRWMAAIHPEDVERTVAVVKSSLASGNDIDVEYRLRNPQGEWRWMRSRGSPRRDANGAIIRWYGDMEDIDDRKKAEHALVKSEALLQAVFDTVPVGLIVATAPDQNILMSNPQTAKIFRNSTPGVKTVDEYRKFGTYYADGRTVQPTEHALSRAIATGETAGPEEFLYHCADGSQTWISLTASPMRDEHGTVTAGVLAIQDINELQHERHSLLECISDLRRQLVKRPGTEAGGGDDCGCDSDHSA